MGYMYKAFFDTRIEMHRARYFTGSLFSLEILELFSSHLQYEMPSCDCQHMKFYTTTQREKTENRMKILVALADLQKKGEEEASAKQIVELKKGKPE